MNGKPLILLPPCSQQIGAEFGDLSLSLSFAYPRAILAAGGIPWISPIVTEPEAIRAMVEQANGMLLTGGNDVAHTLYPKPLPAAVKKTVGPSDKPRDLMELLLIQECLQQKKPLFAICRGQQILNVALGGTLLADIALEKPDALKHRCPNQKDDIVHEIQIVQDSLLAKIVRKGSLGVNSCHHQAVDRVASPLRCTATSADGMVEALELTPEESRFSPFLLAVQFHPERLFEKHGEFLALFDAFVSACRM